MLLREKAFSLKSSVDNHEHSFGYKSIVNVHFADSLNVSKGPYLKRKLFRVIPCTKDIAKFSKKYPKHLRIYFQRKKEE